MATESSTQDGSEEPSEAREPRMLEKVIVRFAGTFDPHTGDDVFDESKQNLAKCQGGKAIDLAFRNARSMSTGSPR